MAGAAPISIGELLAERVSIEDFASSCGIDADTVPADVLREIGRARDERAPDCIAWWLFVAYRAPRAKIWLPHLCSLLGADWHDEHEDIATALQDVRAPETVDCLYMAATRRLAYLEYNDSAALAVKCVWALHDIGTPEAVERLQLLKDDEREMVRESVCKRLAALAARRPDDPVEPYRQARDSFLGPD